MVRKHHCRLCGGIFCDTVSDKRALVPIEMICRHPNPKLGVENLHDPQRLCHPCYDAMQPVQEELQSFSNAVLENKTRAQREVAQLAHIHHRGCEESGIRNFLFSGGIVGDKMIR